MTTLWFTSIDTPAAHHIIENTSLNYCPQLTLIGDKQLTIDYPDEWRWSSGERVLLNLLASISGTGRQFTVSMLGALDEQTRRVAWEAIGIAAGIEGAHPRSVVIGATETCKCRPDVDTMGFAWNPECQVHRTASATRTQRKDHDS